VCSSDLPRRLYPAKVSLFLTPVYIDTDVTLPFEKILLFESEIPSGYSANQELVLNPVFSGLPVGTLVIDIDIYK